MSTRTRFIGATANSGGATAGFLASDPMDDDDYAVGTSASDKMRSERAISEHYATQAHATRHPLIRDFHDRQTIIAGLRVSRFERELCGRARTTRPRARPRATKPRRARRTHAPARRATADPGGDPPRPPLDAWLVVASVRETAGRRDPLCVLQASFTLPRGLDGGCGWAASRFDTALDAALRCGLLDVELDLYGDFWAVVV